MTVLCSLVKKVVFFPIPMFSSLQKEKVTMLLVHTYNKISRDPIEFGQRFAKHLLGEVFATIKCKRARKLNSRFFRREKKLNLLDFEMMLRAFTGKML